MFTTVCYGVLRHPQPTETSPKSHIMFLNIHVNITHSDFKISYVHAIFPMWSSCTTQLIRRSHLLLTQRCIYFLKTWDPSKKILATGVPEQDQHWKTSNIRRHHIKFSLQREWNIFSRWKSTVLSFIWHLIVSDMVT